MNDQQLKPCPFCGSTKVVFRPGDAPRTHIILCLDCDISAGEYYSRSEVIEAWNRRPDTNPWTTITADPATLPPPDDVYFLAIHEEYHRGINDVDIKDTVSQALYTNGEWQVWDGDDWINLSETYKDTDAWEFTPYAWQPWPTSAPYPSADEQNEGR